MQIEQLPFETELKQRLGKQAKRLSLPAGETILADGGLVAGVPIVLEGLVKVNRYEADHELLLYYIRPGESCIMSFSAALRACPAKW